MVKVGAVPGTNLFRHVDYTCVNHWHRKSTHAFNPSGKTSFWWSWNLGVSLVRPDLLRFFILPPENTPVGGWHLFRWQLWQLLIFQCRSSDWPWPHPQPWIILMDSPWSSAFYSLYYFQNLRQFCKTNMEPKTTNKYRYSTRCIWSFTVQLKLNCTV